MNAISRIVIILTVLFFLFLFVWFGKDLWQNLFAPSPTDIAIEKKLSREGEHWKNLHIQLEDPGVAPEPIRALVQKGYQYMLHTHDLLPGYTGDQLDCTHCHFAGGITTGGKNGGISLVGVAAKYPSYNSRSGQVEDLPARINQCFMRSMGGKPLPRESEEMLAFVTYLQWISAKIPIYSDIPWLGLKLINIDHKPDSEKGKELYQVYCASCHGENGEGKDDSRDEMGTFIPPLWGKNSFRKNAGMNNLETFAAFIYLNMPYQNANLQKKEALDIAAFVTTQTRE